MLRKRLIFTLIYAQGVFMQSRNFNLQKVGNLNWLQNNYKFKEISFSLDELVILNVRSDETSTKEFSSMINELVNEVFIPVAAGGGIKSLEDAKLLFSNGADKIVINSILYENPGLVSKLIKKYGSQSVIASIDYKNNSEVFINNGTKKIELSLEKYLRHIEKLNVGEIYLNSIERDGTGFGYDFKPIDQLSSSIKTPIIIAGGAGNASHFHDGLKYDSVSGVATANLFNFIGDGLPNARTFLIEQKNNLAKWNVNT